MERKYGFSYSTHALIIRKEDNNGIRITVTAELPKNLNTTDGETLDIVLDLLLEMADEFPIDNEHES